MNLNSSHKYAVILYIIIQAWPFFFFFIESYLEISNLLISFYCTNYILLKQLKIFFVVLYFLVGGLSRNNLAVERLRGWTLDRGRELTCLTPDWCDCVYVADLAAMTTTELSRCGKAASRPLSGLHSFSFFLSALSIYTFSRCCSYERELNAVMSAELQWCHCVPVISLIKLNKPFRSCSQRTIKNKPSV